MAKRFPGSTGISYKIEPGGQTTAYYAQGVSPSTQTSGTSPASNLSANTGNTGPGGIAAGSYPAASLTQDQRQWLWQYFGHSGTAPAGYGGEGSSGGTSASNSAQSLIDTVVNKYEQLMTEYNTKLSDFDKANPFVYDKVLEEETGKVTQRLEPYYTQTLSDFLTGIERRKTRSIEDQRTLLAELQTDVEDYTGREKINLTRALNNARESAAESGMYFSGERMAGEGETTEASQYNLGRYLTTAERQKKATELGTKRTLEDLSLEESLKRRDIEREKSAQIQSQSLSELLNRQKQRAVEQAEVVGAPPGESLYNYLNSAYASL